ncbi:ABM domain-containing protein [Trichoderma simmonsii]|uniref:ABM domain-containing protein n=2 Tax=Trichoderma TaxID=5543 RepID=A0A1T3CXK8_9HYPO|nr:hypothetical protein A0O28_0093890 [Trichoderma guizhouense]QYT03613.1 ABM domain-containing protein [Trichoderma simmonsii]
MTYSGARVILATVTPRPGKAKKVIELYQGIIDYAIKHEPGCFEFQLFSEVNVEGVEEIFTIERFKDLETLRAHQAGPALVAFNKAAAEQDLLEKEILIKVVKSVSGFQV